MNLYLIIKSLDFHHFLQSFQIKTLNYENLVPNFN
jgi:hypothetical protein